MWVWKSCQIFIIMFWNTFAFFILDLVSYPATIKRQGCHYFPLASAASWKKWRLPWAGARWRLWAVTRSWNVSTRLFRRRGMELWWKHWWSILTWIKSTNLNRVGTGLDRIGMPMNVQQKFLLHPRPGLFLSHFTAIVWKELQLLETSAVWMPSC